MGAFEGDSVGEDVDGWSDGCKVGSFDGLSVSGDNDRLPVGSIGAGGALAPLLGLFVLLTS